MNIYTYVMDGNIYINLTNECSNNCDFCVRNGAKGINGYELWLDKEPSAQDVIKELAALDIKRYNEVVYCGFGEPIYRYDAIKEISDYVHSQGGKTRINTNGQANAILGYDITDEFSKYIDTVNVSLNATNAEKYQEICHSVYGINAFNIMLDFARKLVGKCRVILSVVDCIGTEEINKARAIADSIGAELRVREEIQGSN